MFLMKKFLTKLGNYKLRQRYSKMIFQQKLKEKSDVFGRYFRENINFVLRTRFSRLIFKVGDAISAFKKKLKTSKDNYRPINILF